MLLKRCTNSPKTFQEMKIMALHLKLEDLRQVYWQILLRHLEDIISLKSGNCQKESWGEDSEKAFNYYAYTSTYSYIKTRLRSSKRTKSYKSKLKNERNFGLTLKLIT